MPHGGGAIAEMRAHHLAVALKAAASQHRGIRRQYFTRAALLDGEAGDTPIVGDDFTNCAAVAEPDTCLPGGTCQVT